MKKTVLNLLFVLCLGTWAQAQTVLTEDFSGTWPPSGWTVNGNTTNWSKSSTANAGGTSPEARFYYDPQFTGTTRLVSPALNTSAYTSLHLAFNHFVDFFTANFVIGVATTSGAGTTWNVAWQQTVTANMGPEMRIIPITTSDVGATDFKFCLFFTGTSYNIDYWYIDNVMLFSAYATDLSMQNLGVPVYNLGNEVVKGKFINMGTGAITSVDMNWQADNGSVNTTNLSGFNLALGQSYNFQCADTMSLAPGPHFLKVWINNVNGQGPDLNAGNDTLMLEVNVATASSQRKPCFEDFTSSTCAPCASFNNSVFNAFSQTHEDEMTLVHYCMSWPSPGDPYYTAEGGVRRVFYGVNAVPNVFVDGTQYSTNATGMNTALNTGLAKPAFMNLGGLYTITGNNVNITMDIMPFISGPLKAHIAICEKLTTQNVGNNGETQFHHVMMKMVPDAYGTPVSLTAGTTTSLSYTADMTATFVEEMHDLIVVMWVQDTITKQIFQSEYATLFVGLNETTDVSLKVFPNPTTGMLHVQSKRSIDKLEVYNALGQLARQFHQPGTDLFDLGSLQEGYYFIKVYHGNDLITKKITILK